MKYQLSKNIYLQLQKMVQQIQKQKELSLLQQQKNQINQEIQNFILQ